MWSKQGVTKRSARADPCSWRTHAVSTPVPSSCTSSNQLGRIPSLQGIFQGTKTDPCLEQGRQEQRRPRVMGRKHAGDTTPLPQMRKQVIEHRLFIVGEQPAVRSQGLQFLIHAHAPRWYTSSHATATPSGIEEATEGGGPEGEVIRARHGSPRSDRTPCRGSQAPRLRCPSRRVVGPRAWMRRCVACR